MKKRSFFQLTFMLALCFMFTACSKNEDKTLETDKNKDAKIEVDYKDGYEIAKHENFDDEDDFREVDIYLEGTISKFEDGDVYIKDSAGYEWAVIYTRNHDFEPYIGKKCVCYCRASGVWTAQEDIVLISFEEKKDYKMIIDDDIIYSEFDNCTFHHSYGKDYIAFGGYGDDMISEYHVFDLKENTVRYIRNKDDKWYYAEAKYKGLIFHDVEVEYSDDFLESMEMVDNNRGLLYFINHGTGLIAPLVDADELNTKFNTLKKKDAIKK